MPKHQAPKLILPFLEFERIFRTIHGVLLNEEGDMSQSCLFFGIIGAAILNEHHGLSAIPVIGVAAYNLGGPRNDVLAFATTVGNDQRSSENAFHCWVEVGGWLVDFSSPLFQEMLASVGQTRRCGRKMFQRPLAEVTSSMTDVVTEGAFFCRPNQALSHELIEEFLAKPAYSDLLRICVEWYRRIPKKMIETIGVVNQHGQAKPVRLSPLRLEGAW